MKKKKQKTRKLKPPVRGLGYSSGVENLTSMYKAQGLIPNMRKEVSVYTTIKYTVQPL
jgi:hypothetical protein